MVQRCACYGYVQLHIRSSMSVLQLVLAVTSASDEAVDILRGTSGLIDAALPWSSMSSTRSMRTIWIQIQSFVDSRDYIAFSISYDRNS